jgi:putative tryptophan/tyrosine transport system permease protein
VLDKIVTLALGVTEEGLLYAIMAMGVYITYKILDFPDLSVDGTFPLGGAVTAVLIIAGVNPIPALFISFLVGAGAGALTGIIHVKLKVRDLLSGIIMMTALYSINLRIAGKSNVAIFSKESIFENSFLSSVIADKFQPYVVVVILFIIVIIMKVLLDLYLKTKSGYLLRAVGDNEVVVTSLAKDKGIVKIVGLAIANGFVALAGSIYTQKAGYFEISTGTGTIVIGLASVIIGTNLFTRLPLFRTKRKDFYFKATTAVIFGSIIYKACVAIAIEAGMTASDLKLITAVLFLAILVISSERRRRVKTSD